ncbi:NAD-dependent epimerase/dehydratase family protein [Jatrophihabitans sp. YIM 134969]
MASPLVVVIGANGLVGHAVARAVSLQGATVVGVVRRSGTAPEGVREVVGEFTDAAFTARVLDGADAVVTTVHPMGTDRSTQERIGVEGNATVAREAARAGVARLVHVSTAAVYDRSPGVGDVDESSALVADDANDYAVTKRDTDAAIAAVDGLTRVLVRPPAILGPGATSVWNTLRLRELLDDPAERRAAPDQSFPWVHVDDLAWLLADLAVGDGDPEVGGCTAVNAVSGTGTVREYLEVATRTVGIEPVWEDRPVWTGRLLGDRARSWGWSPTVDLDTALAEIAAGWRG